MMLRRAFSTVRAPAVRQGLEEFYEVGQKGERTFNGQAWTARMLRRKSTEDLHKLWYVLLKERNLLLAEEAAEKSRGLRMQFPFRKRLVRKSMASIKVVLGQRGREMTEKKHQVLREIEQELGLIEKEEVVVSENL